MKKALIMLLVIVMLVPMISCASGTKDEEVEEEVFNFEGIDPRTIEGEIDSDNATYYLAFLKTSAMEDVNEKKLKIVAETLSSFHLNEDTLGCDYLDGTGWMVEIAEGSNKDKPRYYIGVTGEGDTLYIFKYDEENGGRIIYHRDSPEYVTDSQNEEWTDRVSLKTVIPDIDVNFYAEIEVDIYTPIDIIIPEFTMPLQADKIEELPPDIHVFASWRQNPRLSVNCREVICGYDVDVRVTNYYSGITIDEALKLLGLEKYADEVSVTEDGVYELSFVSLVNFYYPDDVVEK